MKRRTCVALGASLLVLAILPAGASATGSPESGDSGGNCSSSGALIAANCTNISGPQTQVGGGLVNEQNQSSSQQNGDSSGTSNANTNGVAVGSSEPSESTDGGSQPSGSGGNCSQHGAIIAANCTNYSGGQEQIGGGLVNQQNQSNNQQNGDNSGTSNANTNGVAIGKGNSESSDGYDGKSNSHPSGSGGNCSQKFVAVSANCTNISKGQEQVGGGEQLHADSIASVGGGSLANQQNQSNNQQNGDNSGTHNYNANVIAVGHEQSYENGNDNKSGSWSKDGKSQSSGSGHNCTQSFAAFALNCTNYSGGQWQSNGDEVRTLTSVEPGGGGGSLANQQNQSNNQQNGDNSGTHNENANVIAVGHEQSKQHGNEKSESWSKDGKSESSGSGGNCSQKFAFVAANCTNISKGQWQSNGGGGDTCYSSICSAIEPGGGGGSLANQQNQSNNQQNGDNSGTHNYNANVIAVGGRPPRESGNDKGKSESWSRDGKSQSSGSGHNCTQSFAAFALNCTNYSGGQWQSNGGGGDGQIPLAPAPGGGGSLANQQNQGNNQQNGDNSGTHNYESNVIIVPGRHYI
jgi:hypothetical protein